MNKGLIVFAREPLPGKVKTRLAASLGDQRATRLYENMLQEVLKTARQLSNVRTTTFWACESAALSRLAERYKCRSRLQNAGELGQRMQAACQEMFAEGCDICCIIGSDAPDLPISYIVDAYRHLEMQHADVVFGPSSDGGYYLLGLRQVWPQLFTKISWGSAEVLTQSLAAAKEAGLTTVLLPEWQDIDTAEDLRAYQDRIQGNA
jgi:rSAM/selenodomain-associated transferase 1